MFIRENTPKMEQTHKGAFIIISLHSTSEKKKIHQMQGKLIVEKKKWSLKSVLDLTMTRIFLEITSVLACLINL
jgi:hypothetical protein